MSNSYKKEEIETAINLLRENGYVVKKLTVGQLEDAKECFNILMFFMLNSILNLLTIYLLLTSQYNQIML